MISAGFSVIDANGNLKVTGTTGPSGAAGAAGTAGARGRPGGSGQRGRRASAIERPVRISDGGTGLITPGTTNYYLQSTGTGLQYAPALSTGVGPGGGDTGSPEIFVMPASGSVNAINNVASSSAGSSVLVDTVGQWCRLSSTVDGTLAWYSTTTTKLGYLDANPMFWTRLRTGSDITNVRIWLGFFSGSAGFSNSDNIQTAGVNTDGCAIRYSTVAADAGWVGVTRSIATGLQSVTASIAAIAASTLYTISIQLTGAGTLATFTVNGASQTLATDIPTGVDLNMTTEVVRVSTANKALNVKYMKMWR